MEPTQVRRGVQALEVSTNALVEAHQRAPTLMGGETPGGQGEVRVWSPNREVLKMHARQSAIGWAFYLLFPLLVITPLVQHALAGSIGFELFLATFFALFVPWTLAAFMAIRHQGALTAVRRPRYLTTDDAGIGVTTWDGSRYLPWGEIAMVNLYTTEGLKLHTRTGEQLILNLSGYTAQERREVMELVVERSGLAPLQVRGWWGGGLYALPGYSRRLSSGRLIPPAPALAAGNAPPSLPRGTQRG